MLRQTKGRTQCRVGLLGRIALRRLAKAVRCRAVGAAGRSALALAVLRSDLAMVKLLLASGANRLAADRFGQTPQGYAAKQADPALRAAFGLP